MDKDTSTLLTDATALISRLAAAAGRDTAAAREARLWLSAREVAARVAATRRPASAASAAGTGALVPELAARLRRTAYFLDEIRAGNAFSADVLWREVTHARAAIARVEGEALARREPEASAAGTGERTVSLPVEHWRAVQNALAGVIEQDEANGVGAADSAGLIEAEAAILQALRGPHRSAASAAGTGTETEG